MEGGGNMAASRSLYIELAKTVETVLRFYKDCPQETEAVRFLVSGLMHDLKQDNIHFDHKKFLKACGIG
jgi:hypothetical protein